MLVDATLLIQDIQLLCFTVIFGVLAFQRWHDATRRWLWYSFLANAAGAIFDLLGGHLPNWIGRGINLEMIPLSYALVNVALVHFERRGKLAVWISGAVLVATLPLYLLWCNRTAQFPSNALGDLAIALESVVTIAILSIGRERPTRAPRLLMGGFLVLFALVEFARAGVAFVLHADPDLFSRNLEITSAVAYIVNVSVLPLAFIWMMNARLEAELVQQSIVDPLTDVLNRRGLERALERELAGFRRYKGDLTVAMLDLDHFKLFNDKYGHAAGDLVLIEVANLLNRLLRETDVVGRLGGEEFVLILPRTDSNHARPVLEMVCKAMRENTVTVPGVEARATASFGATATHGRLAVTALDLLREADVALYEAKKRGRDQVRFFAEDDAMTELSLDESELSSEESQPPRSSAA